jgi:site-specific recombinase XerC
MPTPESSLTRHYTERRFRITDGIRTVQELMSHADVKTTMIYTHVLGVGASGVRSP